MSNTPDSSIRHCALILPTLTFSSVQVEAQQKILGELPFYRRVEHGFFCGLGRPATEVSRTGGVRAKITPAGGGAAWQNAAVGRSAHLPASSSEGLVLAQIESS
jgi:hypothetical protein